MLRVGKIYKSKEEILSMMGEVEIFAHYFNVKKIPCLVSSPLRKDRRPSFSIYYKNGKLLFHDFSTGEHGDIWWLLGAYFKLDFSGVLHKINDDFDLTQQQIDLKPLNIRIEERNNTKVSVRLRAFNDDDIAYWNSYGISERWLHFGRVYAISRAYLGNNIIPVDKYAYAYVEYKDKEQTIKIYQPYSKRLKWLSNFNNSIWSLWEQLPSTGERLIITSSLKDALCIWANTGIPSCSLQSETTRPKDSVMEELKQRFKRIYVLYDNDFTSSENHGRILGKRFAELFDITQIELPEELGCKDSSDLFKAKGRDVLRQTFIKLLS